MPKFKVFLNWEVEEEADNDEEATQQALDNLALSNDSLENYIEVEEIK